MTSGGLANIRNALIFAGGVMACAALAAISMGDNFVPNSTDESYDEARAGAGEGYAPKEASDEGVDDTVFGDYQAYVDDADLIDDTSGFDPTPTADAIASSEPDSSGYEDDLGDADFDRPPTSRSSRQSLTATPRKIPSAPSATLKGLSVEEMKKRLKKPPVIGDGGEDG